MKEDFYVYVHRKKTNNEIYYVGKGRNRRAWVLSKSARNLLWNKIHNKHGTVVEIILSNLTEEQAHSIEKDYILFYGRRNNKTGVLANMTDGGEGTTGFVASDEYKKNVSERYSGESHPRYDKRIWTFYNVDTEEIVKDTRYNFATNNPHINVDSMFHGNHSSRRWVVKELFSEDRVDAVKYNFKGKWNPKLKIKKCFININTLEEVVEYPAEMNRLFGINVRELVTGRNYTCGEWTTEDLINEYGIEKIKNSTNTSGINNPRADKNTYKFINTNTSAIKECTRSELQEKYGINILSLFGKNPATSAFGWMLYDKYLEGKRPLKDINIYTFENEKLCSIIECTRQDFKKLVGVGCKQLFAKNPYKTVAGWRLLNN